MDHPVYISLDYIEIYCFFRGHIVNGLERGLIGIEKRKFLTGNGTVSSLDYTIKKNRRSWNSYDWSLGGEEWTLDAKRYKGLDPDYWKISLVNKMMLKYIKRSSTILEIGPGAGRWTKTLSVMANRLLIADISEKCLEICKEKFRDYSNIEYCLIKDRGLNFVDNNGIDYIWSYDVFIHINPTDIERYIMEFQRILKPGGCAIIHHAGTYLNEEERRKMWRSYMDEKFLFKW